MLSFVSPAPSPLWGRAGVKGELSWFWVFDSAFWVLFWTWYLFLWKVKIINVLVSLLFIVLDFLFCCVSYPFIPSPSVRFTWLRFSVCVCQFLCWVLPHIPFHRTALVFSSRFPLSFPYFLTINSSFATARHSLMNCQQPQKHFVSTRVIPKYSVLIKVFRLLYMKK